MKNLLNNSSKDCSSHCSSSCSNLFLIQREETTLSDKGLPELLLELDCLVLGRDNKEEEENNG